jgi:murein tripeptide amidase MpaA
MHGDEPLGYLLMLRLAEYLLMNYDTDPYVRTLTDNIEIWINPLFNPDGAYFLSDTSIHGATRFNSNQIDLNRDFPDIRFPGESNTPRQAETLAMMHFMEDIQPVLAANFHGGA